MKIYHLYCSIVNCQSQTNHEISQSQKGYNTSVVMLMVIFHLPYGRKEQRFPDICLQTAMKQDSQENILKKHVCRHVSDRCHSFLPHLGNFFFLFHLSWFSFYITSVQVWFGCTFQAILNSLSCYVWIPLPALLVVITVIYICGGKLGTWLIWLHKKQEIWGSNGSPGKHFPL